MQVLCHVRGSICSAMVRGKIFFLNLQFLIMLWPDVKVIPIWHGCKLKSQAIKINSFSL